MTTWKPVLTTCAGCMTAGRDDIDHDESGGWCAWLACGHSVGWQADHCTHPDHKSNPPETDPPTRSQTVTDTATAKIAAVSKAETLGGITPELAARWWDQLGSKHLAIVELKVDDHKENAAGDLALNLKILHLEPVTQPKVADHLRELQRALYFERNPQGDIDSFEDIEPKVADILANAGNVVDTSGDQPQLAEHDDEGGE